MGCLFDLTHPHLNPLIQTCNMACMGSFYSFSLCSVCYFPMFSMSCHGEYHSSPFCRRFYTEEHPQSRPQVQSVLALAQALVGVGWCWQALAGAGWCWCGLRCRRAGTGASVGAGATSSDDVGATPSDSFHTGILSPSSTLGSPIDDGCGPELEPRPVCEGEEPQASHLPGPSPP